MEMSHPAFICNHLPDGTARARQRTSGSAYYSSIDLERLSRPSWRTLYFTHGHPSATGRALDRESSPVKNQRSATVQCSQS